MSTFDQIRRNNEVFGQRFAAGDADGIAALYTANAHMFPPGADMIGGTDAIRSFWASVLQTGLAGLQIESAEVDDLGDTAIDSGVYTLLLPDGSVADSGKYVVVWKHQAGEWKLHRDIWNTNVTATKTAGV